MKIKLTREQIELLQTGSSVQCRTKGTINVSEEPPHEEWFYLPYWYKRCSDNSWEAHSLENVPQSLKDLIRAERMRTNDK